MIVSVVCAAMLLTQAETDDPPPKTDDRPFFHGHLWQPEWRRFGIWDYTASAVAVGTLITLEATGAHEHLIDLGGRTPFEGPIADFFDLDTVEGRATAAKISDHILHEAQLYPYAVDGVLVPLLVHRDPDLAWQMTMMNVQAIAVSTLVVRLGHRFVARDRPAMSHCADDPGFYYGCDNVGAFGNKSSFLAGHVSVVMTAAGVTCAHHQHVPLYGGAFWDDFACGAMLGLGTVQGVLRLMADKHYASDVVLGALIGLAAGYGVPTWLHYEWKPLKRTDLSMTLLPQVTDTTTGATLLGRF